MKQVNIGVGNGLALFVDDSACQMEVGLVGTLHIDLPFTTLIDANRIEADNLHNGIGNGLVLHMGRYTEVFQLVVDKGDVIVGSLRLNVFQGIGKRDILEMVRNPLGANS